MKGGFWLAVACSLVGGCSHGNYDGSWDGSVSPYYGIDGGGFPDASPVTLTVPPEGGTVTSSDGVFSIHVPPNAYSTSVTITITPKSNSGANGTTGYDVSSAAPSPKALVSAMYRLNLYNQDPNVARNLALTVAGQSPPFGGSQTGSPNVFYVVTHQPSGFYSLSTRGGAQPPVTSPASCLQSCCGNNISQGGPTMCFCGDSGDAAHAATCLEQCSDGIAQSGCIGGVTCNMNGGGTTTCGNGQGCCIQPAPRNTTYCEGVQTSCQGTFLQCNGASDCGVGQVCCLFPQGSNYQARCAATCDGDRVCRNTAECATCGYPGMGCAFNTCSRKSLPGVCP